MSDEINLPSPNGSSQFDWGPKPYSDEEIEERARKVVESQIDNFGEHPAASGVGSSPAENGVGGPSRAGNTIPPGPEQPRDTTILPPPFPTSVQELISSECDALKVILIEKNRAYGNSALEPIRIFSKASPEEQLLVRLDDKISRLVRGEAAGEDVIQDLLGYLILLRICRRLGS